METHAVVCHAWIGDGSRTRISYSAIELHQSLGDTVLVTLVAGVGFEPTIAGLWGPRLRPD